MMVAQRYIPAGLAALLGTILSAASFVAVEDWATRRFEAALRQAATNQMIAVERRIDRELEAVRSIVSFFDSSKAVDREEFHIFVSDAISRFPSIQALEWIPRIPASERAL
jgi:CHASE1-domain containing sensor protein